MNSHLTRLYKVTYYIIDLFEKELSNIADSNSVISSSKYITDVLTKLINIILHLQKLKRDGTEQECNNIKDDDYQIIKRFIDKYDNKLQ